MSTPRRSSALSGSADVSTLAAFQLLHSFVRHGPSWPVSVYHTAAFHSSPLRKYLRWLPPYDFLNNEAGRPYRLGSVLGREFEITAGADFVPPDSRLIEEVRKIERERQNNMQG